MRVVWFSHNSDIGGAELCLVEAVESLRPFGVESHVIIPWAGELEGYLRARGIPVSIELHRWWAAWERDRGANLRARRAVRNSLAVPRLIKRLRELRPDVVATNTLAIPSGAFAARALGIPHLWCIQELGIEDMGLHFDWGSWASTRLMAHLTTRAVAVSQSVKDKFARWIPPHLIDVVYNAVDMPARRSTDPPPDLPFRIVVLGAKHPGKRQEDAVRALAILRDQGVVAHLTLVGREDREYGAYLRELVRGFGMENQVEIKTFVEDPYDEIERAHVFVMCSRSEAFGRVTVEAMKLGRPVVGSDRAGTAELIRDGWSGLLYEPENAVDLAAKLRTLHDDRTLLATLGTNAREIASREFTMERYGSRMYDSLRATAAGRSGPLRNRA